MSSFLVIIFQSGRIFEISENVLDSGILFVEKYLLLKKLNFKKKIFNQILQLRNTCAVRWSGKAQTEVSIFFFSVPIIRPLLMVSGEEGGGGGAYEG